MGWMDVLQIPTNRLDLFIRSVEIASYLPGRVRLYLKNMIGNPSMEREVQAYLAALEGIDGVETNAVTGSILIKYDPLQLQKNAELRKVEEYIRLHARRK